MCIRDRPLADRATVANMAPEYGATMGFFPMDEMWIRDRSIACSAPSCRTAPVIRIADAPANGIMCSCVTA